MLEAIVLAGGFGTRLRQVVADVPKPMAPIVGRPFLEYLLSSLARKGFSRVVFALGYMAENVSEYFGNRFSGMEIVYRVEDSPLGTGGAVRLAMDACIQDHVFIFNGDTYLDLEIRSLEQRWQVNRHPLVVGKEVPDTSRYGRLIIDNKRIKGFQEKGIVGSGIINAGCYVLAKDALKKFPLNQPFSIETEYLEPEVKTATVEVFITKGIFIDIGIPKDYERAQFLMADL